MKKYCIGVLAALLACSAMTGCAENGTGSTSEDGIKIVCTNFALYDFARVYETDGIHAEMLIAPGDESHDLEATLSDVSVIADADVLVYAGGESDVWVDTMFESLGEAGENMIRINALELICGEVHGHTHGDGEVHEEVHDEHVWTAIPNAVTLIEEIGKAIQTVDETALVSGNAAAYIAELETLDGEYRALAASSERHEIAVADRFPFTHMAEAYGIAYTAAFDGCTSNVEVPLSVINRMIEEVRAKSLPAVFYIEFSDRTAADAVCGETGAEALLLHSCHNVTKAELENGVTYLDLMTQNLDNLRKALN